MKTSLPPLVVVSLAAAATAVSAAPPRKPNAPDAVAIVCFASGPTVAWSPRSATRREVRLFDWLLSGTRLDVGPGARLDIAFRNGRRYHLEAGASATLGAEDLTASAGPVTALPSLPPLPRLAPIRPDDPAGRRIGAIRLRGEEVTDMYPSNGARALADQASLAFSPVKGRSHLVRLRDDDGDTLLEEKTTGDLVAIPAGRLRSGAHYWWTVETIERTGPTRRVAGEFTTLTEEEQADRSRLHAAAGEVPDVPVLLLMAEVDMALGLRAEGRQTIHQAVEKAYADERFQGVVPDLERRLADTSRLAGR